jgi:hypothetical protein
MKHWIARGAILGIAMGNVAVGALAAWSFSVRAIDGFWMPFLTYAAWFGAPLSYLAYFATDLAGESWIAPFTIGVCLLLAIWVEWALAGVVLSGLVAFVWRAIVGIRQTLRA